MIFYHGTNEEQWKAIQKEGQLFGLRTVVDENGEPSKIFKPGRCTYLAVDEEEAATYGEVVLEVEYDPDPDSGKDNYCAGCWQVRVYRAIPIDKIKRIA